MSHLIFFNFGICHQFMSNLKTICLVTLFEHKLLRFKTITKIDHFWAFFNIYELLSTQNVNVVRFARNVE